MKSTVKANKPAAARPKPVGLKEARAWLPKRGAGAHKGDCGRVLVVAGSEGMHGAGVLVSTAALRAGAGLVRLATVGPVSAMPSAPPEAMITVLPGGDAAGFSDASLSAAVRAVQSFKPDVLAVGPGLGSTPALEKFLRVLTSLFEVPMVIDADALTALAASGRPLKPVLPAVLTPHPGEMARLVRTSTRHVEAGRVAAVRRAALEQGAVCLLKGPGTLVSDGARVYQNTTGNSGMASGGMGDILTGLIAGFWAQMPARTTETAFQAAAFGAFLHGAAADIAVKRLTPYSLLASDVLEALRIALRRVGGAAR
jgi:NAD(P)H-hydrate epimerase